VDLPGFSFSSFLFRFFLGFIPSPPRSVQTCLADHVDGISPYQVDADADAVAGRGDEETSMDEVVFARLDW